MIKQILQLLKEAFNFISGRKHFRNLSVLPYKLRIQDEVLTKHFSISSQMRSKQFDLSKHTGVLILSKTLYGRKIVHASFIKTGRSDSKLLGIQNMKAQSSRIIGDAKNQYFTKISKTLSNPKAGQKTYWPLINTILNEAKIPVIPLLLENDSFVLSLRQTLSNFHYTRLDMHVE